MGVENGEVVIDLPTIQPKKAARGSVLSFNVNFSVKVQNGKETTHKQILKDVSGVAKPGRCLAIMGPSGGGKTSLLDILAHRAAGSSDTSILFDGKKIPSNQVRNIVGYVSQMDILQPTLTVRETLQFYADLKLPHNEYTYEQRIERVKEVISMLYLDKCADTFVGNERIKGISGGEKRRLSIGIELLNEPSVLFLDEPTSGLDASTALNIMTTIIELCKTGRTVICTIHQPRSNLFAAFDELMLLAAGQVVYTGRANRAVEFFEKAGYPCEKFSNPADHFIDILSQGTISHGKEKDVTHELVRLNTEKSLNGLGASQDNLEEELTGSGEIGGMNTTFFQQVPILMRRQFINLFRDPSGLRQQYTQVIIVAILVGLIYLRLDYSQSGAQSRLGVLSFLSLGAVFPQISVAAVTFPAIRTIFIRDRASNLYYTAAFYVSVIFADLPFRIMMPVVQWTIIYWMANLGNDAAQFFYMMLTAVMMFLTGNAMGILISSAMPTTEAALGLDLLLALSGLRFRVSSSTSTRCPSS